MKSFYLSDLEDFCEEYGIDDKVKVIYNRGFIVPFSDIIFAFRCFVNGDKDAIIEYFEIMTILIEIIDLRSYFYNSSVSFIELNFNIELIKCNIRYILDYQGSWNIDDILNKFRLNRQMILKDLDQLVNDFPIAKQAIKTEKEKDRDEFIDKYYQKSRVLSREDMNKLFKTKIDKAIHTGNKYQKDYLDVSKVKYPIILLLFEGDVLVGVSKVYKNLEQRIVNYKKTKSFDKYIYIHFPDNVIDDVDAELIVRYNPVYNRTNSSSITISNSIYRSLNQIKQRYKGVKDIDMWVIKKVIRIYGIPIYNLNNGQIVVDKDLFDEALAKYYGTEDI